MITKIRKLYLEQPLPAYKLAAFIGIHPSMFSQYALGRVVPKAHHLIKLCKYFDLPPEDILGYVDEDDIIDWEEPAANGQ